MEYAEPTYSLERAEAYESIRAEALEHFRDDELDDNCDETVWPGTPHVCALQALPSYGHLIVCGLHGYKHVQRVLNPIRRYTI